MYVFKYFRKFFNFLFVLLAVSEGFPSAGTYSVQLIPDLGQHTVTVYFMIHKSHLKEDGINPFFADIFLKNINLRLCSLKGFTERPDVSKQPFRPIDPSETALLRFQCTSDYFIQHQNQILSIPVSPLKDKNIQPVNEDFLLLTRSFWPEKEKADSLLHEANRERTFLYHLGLDTYLTVYIMGGVNPLDLSVPPDKAERKAENNLRQICVARWQDAGNRVISFSLGSVTPNRITELAWLSDALKDFFHTSAAFQNVRILAAWNGQCRVMVVFRTDDYYPAFPGELFHYLRTRLHDARWKHWYQTRYVRLVEARYHDLETRNLYSALSDYYLGTATRYFRLYVPGALPVPLFQKELDILIGQLNE